MKISNRFGFENFLITEFFAGVQSSKIKKHIEMVGSYRF